MKIEIFSGRTLLGKRWYFRIRADNGQKVAQSEGYRRRVDCIETAYSLRDNLRDAEITVRGDMKDEGDL